MTIAILCDFHIDFKSLHISYSDLYFILLVLFLALYMTHKHLRGASNDGMEHAAPTSPAVSVSEGSNSWLGITTIQRERNESCSLSAFARRVLSRLAKEPSKIVEEETFI